MMIMKTSNESSPSSLQKKIVVGFCLMGICQGMMMMVMMMMMMMMMKEQVLEKRAVHSAHL